MTENGAPSRAGDADEKRRKKQRKKQQKRRKQWRKELDELAWVLFILLLVVFFLA